MLVGGGTTNCPTLACLSHSGVDNARSYLIYTLLLNNARSYLIYTLLLGYRRSVES